MGSNGIALPVGQFDQPAWKTALNWTGAIVIALLFLASGLWKVTDPTGWAVKLTQAKFPQEFSVPGAISLGSVETTAGVLVLVPRFRRWGAWLASALLLAFMIYIGFFYNELRGQDCSCFPWLKRTVGPMFFISDALMLVAALAAGWWARRVERKLGAVLILGAVCVFGLVSYGVAATRETGTKAPETVLVDGKPYSLTSGKIFIYFFDPECLHCLEAGRKLAAMHWGDTKVIGVPTRMPQFAANFMQQSGMKKPVSTDWSVLKSTFSIKGTPGGVALENGREKAQLTQFEGDEPGATLAKLGFIY
jgi:uncharacterized membrane protein YphA (DoxX/SURF4 family)